MFALMAKVSPDKVLFVVTIFIDGLLLYGVQLHFSPLYPVV